jgi:pimeloyl-ACP methyl ester carboxylesterase
MELNSFLFPAPESAYNHQELEDVVWIPKRWTFKTPNALKVSQRNTTLKNLKEEVKQTPAEENYIPCLYLPYPEGADKVLIFFHGNAEDIGWATGFVAALQEALRVHVIAMEYPGYSVYIGEPNAEAILNDAEIVYDFLNMEVGVPQENILLFGRSIGSGPATYLAARKDPGALILMSAYTSIRAVVRDVIGTVAQYLVAERFQNIEEIKQAKCPVLLLHGEEDKLIWKEHAINLKAACSQTYCELRLSENMTHNDFDFEDDILIPIFEFLEKCEIEIENDGLEYDFPPELYEQPESLKNRENKRSMVAKFLIDLWK